MSSTPSEEHQAKAEAIVREHRLRDMCDDVLTCISNGPCQSCLHLQVAIAQALAAERAAAGCAFCQGQVSGVRTK